MATKTKLPQSREPSGRDMFQTPNYATELLVPFIPKHVRRVWECAFGKGKITGVLWKHGYDVAETDLHAAYTVNQMNFLTERRGYMNYDAIITNPPFSSKKQFFLRALEYDVPVAMLIPADYSGWVIDCIMNKGCQKIVPTRRVDYITPTGRSGKTSASMFHSMWLTYKFNLPERENFAELTREMKENI